MSAAPPPPADAGERRAAATTFDRNLCVTAGAGSGKTSLLVERLLTALLGRGTEIGRIVAITFTEKAAAEMRQRLLGALEEIARSLAIEPDLIATAARLEDRARKETEAARTLRRLAAEGVEPEAVAQRAHAAREGECNVSTIHAFALRILQRHPVEAELPAGLAPVTSDAFRRHVRDQLPALVSARLAGATDGYGGLDALFERLTLPALAELVEATAWMPRALADADPADTAVRAGFARELERGADELAARRPAAATRGKLLARWDELVAALRLASRDVAGPPPFTSAMTDAIGAALKPPKTLEGDPRVESDFRLAKRAQELLLGIAAAEEAQVRELLAAVRPLARELRDSFVRAGFITHDGILAACVDLLNAQAPVRSAEAAAIELLLLDEFQDTDPLQSELVLRLCEPASDAAVPRAHPVALERGKLFLVGDVKQSIYRFRGADLEVFTAARATVLEQGGLELTLSTNFRSVPRLLAPLNRLFAAWFSTANAFEPDYVPLVPHRGEAAAAPGVEIWTLAAASAARTAPQRRHAEGRALAAEIARLHAAGSGYGSIVVLLRSLSSVGLYAQPLRERGIPFVLAGGRTFVRRSEVNELASLLLAAADPSDAVACLGALRSTLLAVPDAEIHDAVAGGDSWSWPQLKERGSPALKRAIAWLEQAHAVVKEQPAAIAVERLVEAGDLLPIAAAARDGDQRIANLRKLAALVVASAEELALPLADVVRDLLARQESIDGDAESSLADEGVDAVRILTIHAAKGLEFPTVIVADLARERDPPPSRRPHAERLRVGDRDTLAVGVPSADLHNVAEVFHRERERAHAKAENKRLLYVALTRAREKLILLNGGDAEAPWIEPLRALGYDPAAPPPDGALLADGTVLHRRVADGERTFVQAGGTEVSLATLAEAVESTREAVAAARAASIRFERPSSLADAAPPGAPRDAPARAPGAEFARALGTACHRALARSDLGALPSDAAIAAAVARTAIDEAVDRDALQREVDALLRSAPARALARSLAGARRLGAELPLALARDGRWFHGSADVVFEEAGEIVVGDWKSDADADDRRLAERYRPQLLVYRDALAQAWRLATPPAMELLLLRHGRRLRL